MNYCKDCRWYAEPYGPICYHPDVMTENPVSGPESSSPYGERRKDGKCGPEGRLWERETASQRYTPAVISLFFLGLFAVVLFGILRS